MLGLYIHIPFCNNICPYCDFCKTVSSNQTKEMFVDALLKQMKLEKLDNYTFDTLYIGGGSPSSLNVKMLNVILSELNNYIDLKKLKEFTIELNPNDVNMDLILLLKKYHVSRVSIGVESFNKKIQNVIKRFTTLDEIKIIIDDFKSVGITNINLDLMYAIPSQTMDDLKFDLNIIKNLDVTHISMYSLILEEHTIFYHLYQKGKLDLISEELEEKMYFEVVKTLNESGFIHYETSNFAKKGYESIHNLIYWNCDEYIALGPSGSSYYNGYRKTINSNVCKYINNIKNSKIEYSEISYIDEDSSKKEHVMLNLRKCLGINKDEYYKLFNTNLKDDFPIIDSLISDALLEENKSFVFIPEKYFYISNYIIKKII